MKETKTIKHVEIIAIDIDRDGRCIVDLRINRHDERMEFKLLRDGAGMDFIEDFERCFGMNYQWARNLLTMVVKIHEGAKVQLPCRVPGWGD